MIRKIKAFLRWLDLNGAEFANIDVRWTRDQGYLMCANKELADSSSIAKIPFRLVITSKKAKEDINVGKLLDEIVGDSTPGDEDCMERDTLILVLYLLHLRMHSNYEQHWKPYFDVLPPHFTAPLYLMSILTESDKLKYIELLQNTAIWSELEANFESLSAFYDEIISKRILDNRVHSALLFGDAVPSFVDFMWAYTVIETRAFKFRGSGNEQKLTIALSPLCDFANHTLSGANIRYVGFSDTNVDDSACFQLVLCPETSVKVGEQLCLTYNSFDSHQLFQYYGFVLPGNNLDRLCLNLDEEALNSLTDEPDEHVSTEVLMKKTLLMQVAASNGDERFKYDHMVPCPSSGGVLGVMPSLRLLIASAEDLADANVNNMERFMECTSAVTELRALETLEEMLRCNLDYFTGGNPSTITDNFIAKAPYDSEKYAYVSLGFSLLKDYLNSLKKLNKDLLSQVHDLKIGLDDNEKVVR